MTKDASQATIVVKTRQGSLNNAAKKDLIPANIFGQGKDSVSITLDRKSFNHYMEFDHQGGMLYLSIDSAGKKEPVIIEEVQSHPFRASIQHVNFRRVNLKEEIEQDVAIILVGEAEVGDAEVVQAMQEVTVTALPTNIPESIEVDISGLKTVEDKITLKDLKAPEGVTIVMDEDSQESAVVIVREHKEEVVEAAPADAETAEGATDAAPAPAAEEKAAE